MWDLEGIDVGHKMRRGGGGHKKNLRISKFCTGGLGKGRGGGQGGMG